MHHGIPPKLELSFQVQGVSVVANFPAWNDLTMQRSQRSCELPLELWAVIYSFGLEATDLIQMSEVSREWYHLSHKLAAFLTGGDKQMKTTKLKKNTQIVAQVKTPIEATYPHRGTMTKAPKVQCSNWPFACKLKLTCCTELVDVSELGSVHTLDLSTCLKLEDVSPLRNLHTLDLTECSAVSDVSHLRSLHTLNLSYCTSVRDVSCLGEVHHLNISHCIKVRDVSALGGVHTLIAVGCHGIRSLDGLENVHDLNLSGCARVDDVRPLVSVKRLNVSGCPRLMDVSPLRRQQYLNLSHCQRITDISNLEEVDILILRGANPELYTQIRSHAFQGNIGQVLA